MSNIDLRNYTTVSNVEVANEAIFEIGKFTINWSVFEKKFFNNVFSISKLNSHKDNFKVDISKQEELVHEFKMWVNISGFDTEKYVDTYLVPKEVRKRESINQNSFVNFIDNHQGDMSIDALILVYRIRNNLMHGIKSAEGLSNQIHLFKCCNAVVESAIENSKPY